MEKTSARGKIVVCSINELARLTKNENIEILQCANGTKGNYIVEWADNTAVDNEAIIAKLTNRANFYKDLYSGEAKEKHKYKLRFNAAVSALLAYVTIDILCMLGVI